MGPFALAACMTHIALAGHCTGWTYCVQMVLVIPLTTVMTVEKAKSMKVLNNAIEVLCLHCASSSSHL